MSVLFLFAAARNGEIENAKCKRVTDVMKKVIYIIYNK